MTRWAARFGFGGPEPIRMSRGSDATEAPWLTAMAEHEGLPLALRVRPGADTPDNRAKFPRLVLASRTSWLK
jgi:hypothetical protein